MGNTNLPDDGSYENFIGGIASQPTKLNNVGEVNQSIGDILEYFDNDSTRFTVFLSRFLDKNYSLYYTPTEEEKAREAERKKKYPKLNWPKPKKCVEEHHKLKFPLISQVL